MSKCILVLSVPRSGSSALAGALHRLGVFMGGWYRFQPKDRLNPRGYYEDMDWQVLGKLVCGSFYSTNSERLINVQCTGLEDTFRQLIATRNMEHQLWGVKEPRLALYADHLWPAFKDSGATMKAIAIHRGTDATVASLWRHSHIAYNGNKAMTIEQTTKRVRDWQVECHCRALEFSHTFGSANIFDIHYTDLVRNPRLVLNSLIPFVFNGPVPWWRRAMALHFIDRRPTHERRLLANDA